MILLDPIAMSVVPSEAIAPVHQFVSQGRKLSADLGLLWRQSGPACSPLAYGAKEGFKNMNHVQILKLLALLELEASPSKSLAVDVATVARFSLPGLTDDALDAILAARNVVMPGLAKEDLPAEIWEDIAFPDEKNAAEEFCRHCLTRQNVI